MNHYNYDIIIIGSGVAGALIAAELSKKNIRVLILEAGEPQKPFGDYLRQFYLTPYNEKIYPNSPYASQVKATYTSDKPYKNINAKGKYNAMYTPITGGSTLHWLGVSLRLHPDDFRMQTLFGHGVDWPIDYNELEPWYGKAERELGVAGDSRDDLGSWRSNDYPMPAIPYTYADQYVRARINHLKFDGVQLKFTQTPQARNSIEGYQNRPACRGSNSCIPICPIRAKYDAGVHLDIAKQNGVVIKSKSIVYKLVTDEYNNIDNLEYVDWQGQHHTLKAKLYVLAANGLGNPKILLNSHTNSMPTGLANLSGQVGKNLMDHYGYSSVVRINDNVYQYRGPQTTASIESFRSGSFRKHHAAFRTSFFNNGLEYTSKNLAATVNELVSQGLYGKKLREEITTAACQTVIISSDMEELPDENNYVALSDEKDEFGMPTLEINYQQQGYHRATLDKIKKLHAFITKNIDGTIIDIDHFSASHIIGTTRMGNNPLTSVIDPQLRCHQHKNLYITGSSVFPTSGSPNPTLTLAALSLRLVPVLLKDLQQWGN